MKSVTKLLVVWLFFLLMVFPQPATAGWCQHILARLEDEIGAHRQEIVKNGKEKRVYITVTNVLRDTRTKINVYRLVNGRWVFDHSEGPHW